jgi:hypothetical protein
MVRGGVLAVAALAWRVSVAMLAVCAVGLVTTQVQGLYDGYVSVAPASQQLSFMQVYYVGSSTDVGDVEDALVSRLGGPTVTSCRQCEV